MGLFELNDWIRRLIRIAYLRRAAAKGIDMSRDSPDLCRPFVHETNRHKSLHFSVAEVQSRMSKHDPNALLPDYTRTMMGFLAFDPQPKRIAMIGLGGGSLAKFCYRELPQSRIDVVEINPHVLALRNEFHVPPDNDRFQVHLDDGARFIRQSRGLYDVLLVDAYTRKGIPPELASQEFYDSCREALGDEGIMVSNLYCDDAEDHIGRIRQSFSGSVFIVEEPDDANRVVFACTGNIAKVQKVSPPKNLRPTTRLLLRPTFSRVAAAMYAGSEADF